MSLFCPQKSCKSAKGACGHEKMMFTVLVAAVGIFALAKLMHWF